MSDTPERLIGPDAYAEEILLKIGKAGLLTPHVQLEIEPYEPEYPKTIAVYHGQAGVGKDVVPRHITEPPAPATESTLNPPRNGEEPGSVESTEPAASSVRYEQPVTSISPEGETGKKHPIPIGYPIKQRDSGYTYWVVEVRQSPKANTIMVKLQGGPRDSTITLEEADLVDKLNKENGPWQEVTNTELLGSLDIKNRDEWEALAPLTADGLRGTRIDMILTGFALQGIPYACLLEGRDDGRRTDPVKAGKLFFDTATGIKEQYKFDRETWPRIFDIWNEEIKDNPGRKLEDLAFRDALALALMLEYKFTLEDLHGEFSELAHPDRVIENIAIIARWQRRRK